MKTRRLLMPTITVLDNEFVSMWYYPESKILHHQVHKFFFGKMFQDVMNKGVEIFKKYGATKWLADDRNVSAWAKEDLDWGDQDWFPRVAQSGWKYWAIIMPQKVVGKMTVKQLADSYSSRGVKTRIFSSAEEARQWLEGCA
jgi:hypothetical protein